MFNPRIYNEQENLEDQGFNPADFASSFLPGIPFEGFGDFFPRDDPSFYIPPPDFDLYEHGLPFVIDPVMYQSLQEDFKKFIPGFDMLSGMMKEGPIPEVKSPYMLPKPTNSYSSGKKIGTISIEERKLKVQKFLEKRKRRIFKKRISYACRKRVADSRVRVKGRFVTKEQAEAMVIKQSDSSEVKKEEENS